MPRISIITLDWAISVDSCSLLRVDSSKYTKKTNISYVSREDCQSTIRFMHTNITNEPLCCISSPSFLIILALVYIFLLRS
jgi:hypothetical protein